MGEVVGFPGHRWHRCEHAECPWCASGWLYCERCEGASTDRAAPSLTSECCGSPLSAAVLAAVRYGRLDWRRRSGWVRLECSAELLEIASDLLDLDEGA